MIKLSNLIKEIKINKPGGSRIYAGGPDGTIFKIINFPAIPNIDSIPYEEPEENPKFWEIIEKIQNYSQDWNIGNIMWKGDFSSPNYKIYIYMKENEGSMDLFFDSLKKIDDYQNWEEI